MRMMHRLRAVVFGAAVAGALAYGGSSAVAAPAAAERETTFCGYFTSDYVCARCCLGKGGNHYWDGSACYCF